jgi:hypothetical protein
MALHGLMVKAAPTVVTGLVGAVAFEGVRKGVAKAPLRAATVTATAWGMRVARAVGRKAGAGVEHARLGFADVVAEAKERAGEDAAHLTVVDSGDHDH